MSEAEIGRIVGQALAPGGNSALIGLRFLDLAAQLLQEAGFSRDDVRDTLETTAAMNDD